MRLLMLSSGHDRGVRKTNPWAAFYGDKGRPKGHNPETGTPPGTVMDGRTSVSEIALNGQTNTATKGPINVQRTIDQNSGPIKF